MGLTRFEEAAFRLLFIFHFYMWPFPVKWNYKYSTIHINAPMVKLVPFFHVISLGCVFGWVCLITAFTFACILKRPTFGIANITILVLSWAGLCGVFTVAVMLFRRRHAAVTFFNQLINVADILEQGMFTCIQNFLLIIFRL